MERQEIKLRETPENKVHEGLIQLRYKTNLWSLGNEEE